jgi:hypothetical protein
MCPLLCVSLSIEIKRGGRGNLQRRERKGKLGCGWNLLGARKSWNFREGQEAYRHGVGISRRRSIGARNASRRGGKMGMARCRPEGEVSWICEEAQQEEPAVAGAAGQNEALAVSTVVERYGI